METLPPRTAAITSLKILLSRHRLVEKALVALSGAKANGLVGLLNGLVLPRSQAVVYSGDAMSPTFNDGPESAPESASNSKEILIVRDLQHIFDIHRNFQWLFPDFAAKALEEELAKNPDSERLQAIKESKFMHIFRPVNPGDIVLLKNPSSASASTASMDQSFAASGATPSTSGTSTAAAGGDTAAPSSSAAAAAEAYLVRRVAAVQGQELVSSSGDSHTLEAGTIWVTADNEDLKASTAVDSRTFGPLPLSYVLGRVIYRFSKFDSGVVENSMFGRYFDESTLRTEVPSFTPRAMSILDEEGEGQAGAAKLIHAK